MIERLSIFAMLFLGCGLQAPAQELQTSDGLHLTLRGDGAIASLTINGRSWPLLAGQPSGLLVQDAAAKGQWIPAGGTVQAAGGRLVQRSMNLTVQLELEAVWRAAAGAITVEGFIRDTSGRDRAVTVRLGLPIDAAGGTWWQDIQRAQPITNSVYASLQGTAGIGATGTASRYPWAALSCASGELCLGVPMDHFVVHRIAYDGRQRSYYLEFDFGLSRLTKAFPARADFTLVLFTADPAWGFRSAAAKYYTLHPEAFRRRAVREGLWMPFTDVAKVDDGEDFNFMFQEGGTNVAYEERHGIYSFPYLSPHWAWLWMPDRKEKPTPEYIQERLAKDVASPNPAVRKEAELVRNCAAKDAEGGYQYSIGQAHWAPHNEGHLGWYVMFAANADPELRPARGGPTTGAGALADVERIIARYNGPKARVDGFYFDGVDERPLDNYATEQFASASSPLTFGTRSRRPILCGPFCSYKLVREIAQRMWATGRMTMANGIPSRFPFSLAYLDVGGSEQEPSIEREPVSIDYLVYTRTLMHHKPLVLLYKPRLEEKFDRDLSPYLLDYMNRCLLYAAEPSLFKIFSSTDPSFYYSFFERPDWYNRYRPLFLEYVPLVKRLALAGWEPVTQARPADPRVLLERFGSGAGTHLVAYNPLEKGPALTTDVQIELDRLEWPHGREPRVAELISGRRIPATRTARGVSVRIELAARRAAVLAIRPAESALADFDLEDAARHGAIAESRLRDLLEQPLAIDFESDPDGDGIPVGFHRYTEGSAEWQSDRRVFRSAPRSSMAVLQGKSRATLSVSLPVVHGRSYEMSVWVKSELPQGGNVHFYVRWVDRAGKDMPRMLSSTNVSGTSDWKELTLRVTAPENAAKMMLVLVATKSGPAQAKVWFDDPRVVELGQDGRQQAVLPLEPKVSPAKARQFAEELRGLGKQLAALQDQAANGAGIDDLARRIGSAAGSAQKLAGALRATSREYRGVAAALDNAGRRLHRAAEILKTR